MDTDPVCPTCGGCAWRVIGKQRFLASDAPRLPEYDQKRYRVLFEVWRPGDSEFEVRILACEECALVIYAPRPSSMELDAKYAFLCALEEPGSRLGAIPDADRWRARRLYRETRRYLPNRRRARILDYGGGDGRLLEKFVSDGHQCFTIDWTPKVIDGVARLGSTLESLDIEDRFDLVLASHVIEHLAEPRQILEQLRRFMTRDSAIYVEVPLEIWGGPPRMSEPVTHVNFFVPGSLGALMEAAGVEIVRCSIGDSRSGSAVVPVIRAVGRLATGTARSASRQELQGELNRFLRPTRAMRLLRRLRRPSSWLSSVGRRVRRTWAKS